MEPDSLEFLYLVLLRIFGGQGMLEEEAEKNLRKMKTNGTANNLHN